MRPYNKIQKSQNIILLCLLSLFASVAGMPLAYGQDQGSLSSVRALKQLSIEELMDIEVTLPSRTPVKLTEVASAIQVITTDDILRSGATSLPEALRLASNL